MTSALAESASDFLSQVPARSYLGVDRSASGRQWLDRLDAAGQRRALAMAQRHDLPELVCRVAAGRGVDPDEVERFLDPKLKALMPDPSTLAGMETLADRLSFAIQHGERIAIFGDYDVDGATSAALLARFLKWNGIDPLIHIPDRIVEGYGPNQPAIETLAGQGATLLVTVDCGSASTAEFQFARSIGLDVLVIDHHQISEALPPALAIVNPNRHDDISGQGHLAAVGVTFLALVAVNRALRGADWYSTSRPEPDLLAWLDLVALGTVADVVPLSGLNRAYVRQGLMIMRRREAVGLAALADVARLKGPVESYHLGFLLGPRINAGGRIGDSGLGVRLLLCDRPDEAAEICARLEALNSERQEVERSVLEEAMAGLAAADAEGRSVLIAHSDSGWHPGVLGLVAARLKERYNKPSFAIAFGPDGLGTGSGRSIRGVDLGAAVRAAVSAGLAVKGGGHAMAAGLTVQRDRIAALGEFLDSELAVAIAANSVSELKLDGALTAAGAKTEIVHALEAAGPFGSGSPEPVLALPAHRVSFAEATEQGHIRCAFSSPDGGRLKAIAFRAIDTAMGEALLSARGGTLHAAGVLRIDHWGGREEVCMHLRDVAAPRPR